MFAARCLGVSLAVFVVVYAALSLAVSRGWRFLLRVWKPRLASDSADLLFGLRMFPLAISVAVTLLFTLPSFLWLEPRSTDEAIGVAPLLLGAACLLLFAVGMVRAAAAHFKTSRAMATWLESGSVMEAGAKIPVVRTPNAPNLTVAGVRSPKVFVSEATAVALTPAELRTAVRHELSHVRRYDNLKKQLFRFAVFPGMADLQGQWSEATEMAADDAAVSNRREALDLAAALIKVSRLGPMGSSPALAIGLLHSSTALSARIEHLFEWRTVHAPQSRSKSWRYSLPAGAAAIILVALTYSPTLMRMHALTEWLVR
jgi:beta-lactamase regulating signal transducer with metallopeptidase domain